MKCSEMTYIEVERARARQERVVGHDRVLVRPNAILVVAHQDVDVTGHVVEIYSPASVSPV